MKLWVDDERPAPDGTWTVAKDSATAISHLYMLGTPAVNGTLEEVSLDHDLGGEDTGFKVLDWMVQWGYWPKVLTIHTSNPPARKRMLQTANHEGPADMDIYVIVDHLRKEG